MLIITSVWDVRVKTYAWSGPLPEPQPTVKLFGAPVVSPIADSPKAIGMAASQTGPWSTVSVAVAVGVDESIGVGVDVLVGVSVIVEVDVDVSDSVGVSVILGVGVDALVSVGLAVGVKKAETSNLAIKASLVPPPKVD